MIKKKLLEVIEAKLPERVLTEISEKDKKELKEAILNDLISLGMHFGDIGDAVIYTYDFEASLRGHSDKLQQIIKNRIIKLKEMYEYEVSLLSEYYLNIKAGMDDDEASIIFLNNFA